MARKKILVIEDDRSLAEVLEYNLSQSGYEVTCAFDGMDGLNQARLRLPDLILLDLMIPVIDGIEVCKRLRANSETRDTPVVMLTAKGEETDQLVGFTVGADDYVVKPFSVVILLERIKSLLRRVSQNNSAGSDLITRSTVTVDRARHSVTIDNQPVDLTPSEFRLLETLIRQPGRVFERAELIDAALGADTLVLERTIDVHIRSLRKKLGEEKSLIQTVRGIGYRFRDNPLPSSQHEV